MNQPPNLLTVNEVAERLGISVSLVYQMVESGKLTVLRIGNGRGTIRFHPEDLESYLNTCRVQATQPETPKIRPRLKHIKL